jgi:hypothetical protein
MKISIWSPRKKIACVLNEKPRMPKFDETKYDINAYKEHFERFSIC